MYGIDIVHIMQFLFIAIMFLSISYCIFIFIDFKGVFGIVNCSLSLKIKTYLNYICQLTIYDYTTYHKYDIWRCYRFSRSLIVSN